MDNLLKQRVYELEKEAIKIQEEIKVVMIRLSTNDSIETLRSSRHQLKLLNKDLKENNKEMKKVLKEIKKNK